MTRGVNLVILVGHVCNDPELVTMPNSGTNTTRITLATNDYYKNHDGERVETVEYSKCVLYGRLAEVAAQYLHKGSKAYIEGKLQTRSYEKDGVKHYTTEIIVKSMQLLDSRADQPQQDQHQAGPSHYYDDNAGRSFPRGPATGNTYRNARNGNR